MKYINNGTVLNVWNVGLCVCLSSLTVQVIYLKGLTLQTVTEIRYLEVIIASKLSFKSHLSSIISKAYGALKTLTLAQASLPLSIRQCLYKP